jgi:hypothetical protein
METRYSNRKIGKIEAFKSPPKPKITPRKPIKKLQQAQ